MWNSRDGCLSPGRMPSPQILDLIKFSFLGTMRWVKFAQKTDGTDHS